jgi:hypothetical protein
VGGEDVAGIVVRYRQQVSEVDVHRLYSSTDAAVWAEEFMKVHPENDEGDMIGWFANAIEATKGFTPLRCSPDQPCNGVSDYHIDLWGECFVKSYERFINLGSGTPEGTVVDAV